MYIIYMYYIILYYLYIYIIYIYKIYYIYIIFIYIIRIPFKADKGPSLNLAGGLSSRFVGTRLDLLLLALPILRGEGEDCEELDAQVWTPQDELTQLLTTSSLDVCHGFEDFMGFFLYRL